VQKESRPSSRSPSSHQPQYTPYLLRERQTSLATASRTPRPLPSCRLSCTKFCAAFLTPCTHDHYPHRLNRLYKSKCSHSRLGAGATRIHLPSRSCQLMSKLGAVVSELTCGGGDVVRDLAAGLADTIGSWVRKKYLTGLIGHGSLTSQLSTLLSCK